MTIIITDYIEDNRESCDSQVISNCKVLNTIFSGEATTEDSESLSIALIDIITKHNEILLTEGEEIYKEYFVPIEEGLAWLDYVLRVLEEG